MLLKNCKKILLSLFMVNTGRDKMSWSGFLWVHLISFLAICKEFFWPNFLERKLGALARNLEPNPAYLATGEAISDIILEHVKDACSRKGLEVDRTCKMGSTAKGTCISYADINRLRKYPDFDLVIFLNNETPPFDHALEILRRIIVEAARNGALGELRNIKKSKRAVQFQIKIDLFGWINIDLCPAENKLGFGLSRLPLVRSNLQARGVFNELDEIQTIEVEEHGRVNAETNRLFASSLCEASVRRVESWLDEEPHLENTVRLAKFWNANLQPKRFVPARSYMIELIAFESLRDRENNRFFDGLQRFLKLMCNLGTLYLDSDEPPCRKRRLGYFWRKMKWLWRCFTYYTQWDPRPWVDREHLQSNRNGTGGPIIVDLVNGARNVVDGITPEAVRFFQEKAAQSLQILETLKTLGEDKLDEIETLLPSVFHYPSERFQFGRWGDEVSFANYLKGEVRNSAESFRRDRSLKVMFFILFSYGIYSKYFKQKAVGFGDSTEEETSLEIIE